METEYNHICSHGHHLSHNSQPDWADILAAQWMDAIRYAYSHKGFDGGVYHPIVKATGAELVKGVDVGYGILQGTDYGSPDYIMREYLKRNVWKFSVAKNYNDSIRLSNLLIRKDGSVRPWHEFKKEALFVVGASNRYLKTEYDTIVAGAQMSRLWQEIQRDKYIFPFVQFDVVLDGRTSEICEPLHNLIFKVDDPVLAYYFPPNHFNCRTTVRKLRTGVPSKNYQLPDIPEAFKNNVGASKEIFTADNNYILNTEENVLKEADRIYLKELRRKVMSHAEANYIKQTYEMTDGKRVVINKKGFKHFLNEPHDKIIEKNILGLDLERVLRTAEYVKSSDDVKGRPQFRYHYYKVSDRNDMFVVIREVLPTGEYQFYSVVQSIK